MWLDKSEVPADYVVMAIAFDFHSAIPRLLDSTERLRTSVLMDGSYGFGELFPAVRYESAGGASCHSDAEVTSPVSGFSRGLSGYFAEAFVCVKKPNDSCVNSLVA